MMLTSSETEWKKNIGIVQIWNICSPNVCTITFLILQCLIVFLCVYISLEFPHFEMSACNSSS